MSARKYSIFTLSPSLISAFAFFSSSSWRAEMAIFAPHSARPRAHALPIPLLPPVGIGCEHGFDFTHDLAHDFSGDAGHGLSAGDAQSADADGHDAAGHHGSSWLFAVISFRTLVAAAAFFGLTGLATQSAGQP